MNLKKYLDITPEIAQAVSENRPVVALESTILSHGMPYPQNLEFAHKVEEIIRAEGAVPATTAILGGKLKVGLTADELERMCKPGDIGKVSRRDVAVYLAQKRDGATTVATTMLIASLAGIRIFATGGIGGVHRGPAGAGEHPGRRGLRGGEEPARPRPHAGIPRDVRRAGLFHG